MVRNDDVKERAKMLFKLLVKKDAPPELTSGKEFVELNKDKCLELFTNLANAQSFFSNFSYPSLYLDIILVQDPKKRLNKCVSIYFEKLCRLPFNFLSLILDGSQRNYVRDICQMDFKTDADLKKMADKMEEIVKQNKPEPIGRKIFRRLMPKRKLKTGRNPKEVLTKDSLKKKAPPSIKPQDSASKKKVVRKK